MKTTIDFPENLLQRAKIAAVQRKSTLRELVFEGLELVLSQPPKDESSRSASEEFLTALQAGNTEPMVPLTREEVHAR